MCVDKKPIKINFYCYGQSRLTSQSLFAKMLAKRVFRLFSHAVCKTNKRPTIERGESNRCWKDICDYVK